MWVVVEPGILVSLEHLYKQIEHFYGIKNGSSDSELKYMDVFRWLTSPREGFCMHTSIYIMITVAAAGPSLGTIFSNYVNQVPGCLLGFCCLGTSCLSSQAVS